MAMDFEDVVAGVGANGLPKTYEHKVLCCYVLNSVGAPLTLPQLYAAINTQNLAGYIEVADALTNLVKTGHLTATPDDQGELAYAITPVGQKTAEVLGTILPAAARQKAADSALLMLAQMKREAMGNAKLVQEDGSMYVQCVITDQEKALASVRFLVPDELQGQGIIRHFMADPEGFYRNLMTGLIQDEA